jgi:hypothetical protein
MKRVHALTPICLLTLLLCLGTATAQTDTFIYSGETMTVGPGDTYERVVVYPNATLIIDGGSITQSPPVTMNSVEVTAGGTCVMIDGNTDFFFNNGRLEMYGGRGGPSSSANHGYIKLAGGDLGQQIVMMGGILEIFYPAATRTNLEISAYNQNAADAIRLFTTSNSLGYGFFEIGDLPPLVVVSPPYGTFEMEATFWSPDGEIDATIAYLIPTNWNGMIICEPFEIPASTSIVCTIDSAIDLTWGSVSNRGYQVQTTTNLLSDVWENLGTPVYNTQFENLYFDEANEDIKAYRAKIVH